jgi:hypothetical protein
MEGILLWRQKVLLQCMSNECPETSFLSVSKLVQQTESKESKWDMPDELLLLLEKVEKEKQNSQLVIAGSIPYVHRFFPYDSPDHL